MFKNKERIFVAILIFYGASLFLFGLGKMPLTDPDEVFYAETAKEMHAREEFLTPYIFGEPQFEKPPFYYWLVELSFRAFGINEFTARFPSAVFGIFGIIGIYLLGKALFNARTGFFAGIILATNVKYLILSRACVTDIVLCVFILFAFLFFFYGYKFGKEGKAYYLVSAFFLGLAVLTKGPIGLALPGLIILLYLIFTGELKKLKDVPFFTGILLFLAVSAPWYILMYKAHGKEFIDVFFGFHNVIRFLEPEHKIGDVFYYYLPVMLGGFFPWSIFLPLGVWQIFREKDQGVRNTNIFLSIWIFVIFIFFSISRTKLPTYIFPLYPALALLIARFGDLFLEKRLSRKQGITSTFSAGFLLFSIVAGFAVLYSITKTKYATMVPITLAIGGILFLLMSLSIWLISRKKYTLSLALFMLSFLSFVFVSSYFLLPELGKYESSKHISERLSKLAKPGEPIGVETRYRRGVAYYTGREDIPDIHPHHLMTGFLSRKKRVWAVIKEKNYDQLYDDPNKPFHSPGYIVYKFGKKVIVTNKRPSDGKFIRMRK